MVAASFLVSSLFSVTCIHVLAFPNYQNKIPNAAEVQRNGAFHPGVGHNAPSGGGLLNSFGQDFQEVGHEWTTVLCQKDSDNDGQSNGLELGDPDCVWEPGQTPLRSTDISHPGFDDSLTSAVPASVVTLAPTQAITRNPTLVPTATPITPSPTQAITRDPTPAPTATPITPSPTQASTRDPTLAPTVASIVTPSPTQAITRDPTRVPTAAPIVTPSSTPTLASTAAPTQIPTRESDITVVVPTPAPSPAAASHCESLVAELWRRQEVEFPSSRGEPFDGDVNLKHKPFLRIWGQVAIVTVSPRSVTGNDTDPLHPMKDSTNPDEIHYIDTLFALDQNGAVASLHRLSSREAAPAGFSFLIPDGVTVLTPYEHCNKHGLFKGDAVTVWLNQTTVGAPRCSLAVCDGVTRADCTSTDVELRRQHAIAFNVSEPFKGEVSVKHKPYLTVSGITATVVVGLGALRDQEGQPIHPMIASANPAEVHWVDHIWVKDQDGVVVAMRDLDATEPSPAMLTFEVPEGTTQLVAYEHCNLHGIFKGDPVTVTANQTAAGRDTTCNARFCNGQVVSVSSTLASPTSTTTSTTAYGSTTSPSESADSGAMHQSVGIVLAVVNAIAGAMVFGGKRW